MSTNQAMGAMEDLAMLRAAHSDGGSASAADLWEAAGAMGRHTRAIRARDVTIEDAKRRLGALSEDYVDLAAVSLSSRSVIDKLCEELARALHVDVNDVRARAYDEMSAEYDKRIDTALEKGELKEDPRRNPDVVSRPSRDWYTPEA